MKIDVKRLIKDEKGAALAMALILLLIGGLMAAPLLSFMGTGILSTRQGRPSFMQSMPAWRTLSGRYRTATVTCPAARAAPQGITL